MVVGGTHSGSGSGSQALEMIRKPTITSSLYVWQGSTGGEAGGGEKAIVGSCLGLLNPVQSTVELE